MTELWLSIIGVGVWAIAAGLCLRWAFDREHTCGSQAPPIVPPYTEPSMRPEYDIRGGTRAKYARRRLDEETAYSPEGWGPPDSEVISTEGDDYLARMHRPRPEDSA